MQSRYFSETNSLGPAKLERAWSWTKTALYSVYFCVTRVSPKFTLQHIRTCQNTWSV